MAIKGWKESLVQKSQGLSVSQHFLFIKVYVTTLHGNISVQPFVQILSKCILCWTARLKEAVKTWSKQAMQFIWYFHGRHNKVCLEHSEKLDRKVKSLQIKSRDPKHKSKKDEHSVSLYNILRRNQRRSRTVWRLTIWILHRNTF